MSGLEGLSSDVLERVVGNNGWVLALVSRACRVEARPVWPSQCVGTVERLEWAGRLGCPWATAVVLEAAITVGSTKVVRAVWGRGHTSSDERRACAAAAWVGRLGILRWLRANQAEWDVTTIQASVNHRHVFQWVVQNGCPGWGHWAANALFTTPRLAT
jgi:hypothetical protein